MSSKLAIALFATFGAWLLVVLATQTTGYETEQSALVLFQSTPVTPSTPQPTPTIDRLAAPPTVENPNQADEGAQLFWLHCQPCHGDMGQGLTDEWRQQYPVEDQNCWESGCHGKRPYEEGFILPTAVPAVIGEDTLTNFETMAQVYGFISAAMPYQDPGHLSQEEYLAITAFLARAHGHWDGTTINSQNVGDFQLNPEEEATVTPEPAATIENEGNNESLVSMNVFIAGLVSGITASLVIIVILMKRRRPN